MFDKILVPLDGSKLAEQVFPHVALLARAFKPEIYLVGVFEPEQSASGKECRLYKQNEAELLKSQLGSDADRLHQVTLEGNAAEKILEYAREQGTQVILASSHGRSGLKPWPLGSTVNRLLHELLPIVIIRSEEQPASAGELFSRVLVPLDGSDISLSVIEPLRQLSQRMTTGITLLEVIEKEHHVHTIGGLDVVPYLDANLDAKRSEAEDYLKKAAQRFEGTRARVDVLVRTGNPADEILKQAADMDASLIAMSSHVHSAVECWFYCSVTQKIIGAAGRSFMLVPSKDAGK
jgi:nucleotide-binding universal stress UspA family protein